MDSTGQTNAWVREAAALALAELTTKDTFVEAAENGDVAFPMLCSCRFLIRVVRVDASAQDLVLPPSKSSDLLQPLIAACGANTGCILPCSLANLAENALYVLEVKGANRNLPCKLGLAFGVVQKEPDAKARQWLLRAYRRHHRWSRGRKREWIVDHSCHVLHRQQPPHALGPTKAWAKTMVLIALIAGIDPSARIITLSAVHLLQQDALQIKAAFQKYKDFATQAAMIVKSKKPLEFTPTRARKCCRLSRSPSAEP